MKISFSVCGWHRPQLTHDNTHVRSLLVITVVFMSCCIIRYITYIMVGRDCLLQRKMDTMDSLKLQWGFFKYSRRQRERGRKENWEGYHLSCHTASIVRSPTKGEKWGLIRHNMHAVWLMKQPVKWEFTHSINLRSECEEALNSHLLKQNGNISYLSKICKFKTGDNFELLTDVQWIWLRGSSANCALWALFVSVTYSSVTSKIQLLACVIKRWGVCICVCVWVFRHVCNNSSSVSKLEHRPDCRH